MVEDSLENRLLENRKNHLKKIILLQSRGRSTLLTPHLAPLSLGASLSDEGEVSPHPCMF